MPRTEKQFEEIREFRKAMIMDVALELFANEGYYPTSISKIASKAGISKGLMYNYFKSKEVLITEILNIGIEKIVYFIDPDHDGILTGDEMEYFIHEIFSMVKANTDYWKLYFATMMQAPVYNLIKEKMTDILPQYMNMLVSFYERKGVENPVGEAILFGAMMDGIGFNYILSPEKFPIDEIEKLVIRRFCHNDKLAEGRRQKAEGENTNQDT